MRSSLGLTIRRRVRLRWIWAAVQARSVGAVLRAVHVLDWPYGLSSAGFPAPANFKKVDPRGN